VGYASSASSSLFSSLVFTHEHAKDVGRLEAVELDFPNPLNIKSPGIGTVYFPLQYIGSSEDFLK
jgi:hypothetical protein